MILRETPMYDPYIFLPRNTNAGDKHKIKKGSSVFPCTVVNIPEHRRFAVLECGGFLECWPIEPPPHKDQVLPVPVMRNDEKWPEGTGWQKRLRSIRLDHGMTIRDVSKAAGVTESTYGEWERCTRKPSPENLRKLVKVFPELEVLL